MLVSIMDVVGGADHSKKKLSGDHHCSRELKYARVGDTQITIAPTTSIVGRINASLWPRNSSINTSDMLHS